MSVALRPRLAASNFRHATGFYATPPLPATRLLPLEGSPGRAYAIGPLTAVEHDYKHTLTCAVGGSAPSRPTYTITYPAGSNYGVDQLYVENVTTGNRLTVIRYFTPGDVTVIDCGGETVKVNGVAVEPYGRWPILDPSAAANNSVELHVQARSQPTMTFQADWTARFRS